MAKSPRKITLGLILSWFLGVIFGISGVSFLFSGSILSGFSLILASIILLPPAIKFSKEKFNLELSRGLRVTLVIVLLIIYSVSLPSDTSNLETFNQQPSQNTFGTTGSNQQPNEPLAYSLGDRITLENFAYTFLKIQKTSHVGDSYFGEDASGIFLIFDLEVENLANDAEYVNNEIYIVDSQGREFTQDGGSWIYLEDNFIFEELNPGLTKKGQIIFDVPQNMNGKLCIKKSIFSSDCSLLISYS